MIEMQQECERYLLHMYGTKAVLVQRLKQHFKEHRHHSSKRAKPQNISSFFASYQPSISTEQGDQREDLQLIFLFLFCIFFVDGHLRSEAAWVVGLGPT